MSDLFSRDPNGVRPPVGIEQGYIPVQDPAVFQAAFTEGIGKPYLGKIAPGPYLVALTGVLDPIMAEVQSIHHLLDLGYLMGASYYSSPMKARIDSLRRAAVPDIESQIEVLRKERVRRLSVLAAEVITPDLESQTIEPDVLTVPPYLRQGDSLDDKDPYAEKGCANACFRMAYGAMTGEIPNAVTVANAATAVTGNHLISNTQYLNIFHSAAVTRVRNGNKLLTVHIPGASLAFINKLAVNARKKWEGASVVTIVSLASEAFNGAGEYATHQSILLSANEATVSLHDPSRVHGGPKRELDKAVFSRRWTIGLNEAMVVIAPTSASRV
jgi:hypothetical protein